MKQDNILADIFSEYNPTLYDDAEFMKALNTKLEAVEYIKQYNHAQIRRSRYMVVAALVMGIVVGVVSTAYLLLFAGTGPVINISVDSSVLMFIIEHSRAISLMIISIFMVYAIIGLINAYQEISTYFYSRKNRVIGGRATIDNN